MSNKKLRAVVSLSGGADSATVLAIAKKGCQEIRTFGFYYGSKHNRWELESARNIASHYNVPFTMMDISPVLGNFKSSLLLNQGEIPEGNYNEENMRSTVVPCRNLIFISILAGIADSIGFNEVWIGVHDSDKFIYPDCRIKTIEAMKEAISKGTDERITIVAPLQTMTKGEVIKAGISLRVPYHLTRSCYKDNEIACGKCGTCRERLEAFEQAGEVDPIPYQG